MPSIQASPYPLAFPLARADALDTPGAAAGMIAIRTVARALEGMQKECLVKSAPDGRAWRLVCDEGPYLNGTDLAPFPLAFFSTGLVTGHLAEILARAERQGIALRQIELTQDNFYSMEGSALRGDMVGGALPVALEVTIEADAPAATLSDLVMSAIAESTAGALLRAALASEFSIEHNGQAVSAAGAVRPWPNAPAVDVSDAVFDAAQPDPRAAFPPDIITKLGSTHEDDKLGREPARAAGGAGAAGTGAGGTGAAGGDAAGGDAGGAGSSLRAEQKRTLHIRGMARLRPDGLAETRIHLHKPSGSNFAFLCELGARPDGEPRAPAPLHYLSAGVAFCYLTQIGRYVTITKQPLRRYALAQDTAFGLAARNGALPAAEPVRTRVTLESDLDEDAVRRIVRMGEQTCFLHAAARTALATEVCVNIVT